MPERMCIVTREVRPDADLIRFVRSPAGEAVPDLARKLPGRGVWVSLDRQSLVEAREKRLFSKGFGAATTSPDGLEDMVSGLLRRQAVSFVSLARKAGEALCGFMKVEEALRKGPVRVLLHASSAAADGVRKLNRLAQARTLIFPHFTAAELDLAFGRSNVVHAAVAQGGLAEKLGCHLRRLALYDGLDFDYTEHSVGPLN